MTSAPARPDEDVEQLRLAALDAYGILDTPPEKGFDDIVLLARRLCTTPIALVTLVAEGRQWFKARSGLDVCETSLSQSVCVHALSQSDLLIIPDLALDARTRNNALVTDGPRIRFYAGAPLTASNGPRIGSLCVIDTVPRPSGLSSEQAESLRALAGQVMAQLELRRILSRRDRVLAEQSDTVIRHRALVSTQAAVSKAGGRLDAVLDAVVAGAMRAVPQAEGAAVEMLDGDELVYRAGSGALAPHVGLRLPVRGSLSGSCLLLDEPILCPDVRKDGRVKQDVIELLGMLSAIYVPVSRAGETICVLKVQSGGVAAFGLADVETLSLLAGTVASGVSQVGEANARREARATADRYRAVFESAIDYAIIVMDLDGCVTDWNAGATRILGWEPGEMCGKAADVFFTLEDRTAGIPAKEMRSALAEGRGIDERWHLRKDGERFWANGEMMALRDADGEAIGFIKILRDRTEQKRSAEELQRRTDLLRTVTDNVGQAVLQMDRDGTVTFANPAAEAMFGWTAADLIGNSLHDTLHHSHPNGSPYPAAECPFVDALHTGATLVDREDTFFRRDGTSVRVLATNAPVLVGQRVVSAVLTVSDITARKAAEVRQVALIELGDRLRDLDDKGAIAGAAAEILGRALESDRAGYGTVHADRETVVVEQDWTAPDLKSVAGLHRLCDYGRYVEALKRGETVCIEDVKTDPRTAAEAASLVAIDVCALLNIPIMEHGRLVALVFALSRRPRRWSSDELAFAHAVADRTRSALGRVEAEERQDLLNHELSHRMKNQLAMVQSIAMQTTRGAKDVETVRDVLGERLVAMGKAHDLLLGGTAHRARIEPVLRGGVGVHDRPGEGRIAFEGPDIEIDGDAALALSLMLHELSTNAAKYGALSVPGGRIGVVWIVVDGEGGPDLRIVWTESGGPPVAPPSRKGFGSRLIERGVTGQVGGTVTLDYAPAGLTCTVQAPLAAFLRDRVQVIGP